MNDLLELSENNLQKAHKIIDELKIFQTWNDLDSACHLVGSVKTGLILHHRDIDFHVYSNDFSIDKSFAAIAAISNNAKIREAAYKNLLDAEDMCLEWHLQYEESPEEIWTIDIIHIKNESPYAGMVERVTDSINRVLTNDLRDKILQLKDDCYQQNTKVMGIEIYEAVIEHQIYDFDNLMEWKNKRAKSDISLWEPKVN